MIRNKLISVPKNTNGGTTIIKGGSSGKGGGGEFEPHSLWGQYFDDTEDISGDLVGVGSIEADGDITTEGDISGKDLYGENLYIESGATVDSLAANTISAATFDVGTLLSEKIGLGNEDDGYWIIEEDNNQDLLIHVNMDKTFRLQPNETEVLTADDETVKINKKLDLTNEIEGTNVVMGTESNDRQNNNLKSVEEDGFFIVDNNNNVAIGVTNNYVTCGADIGSPNFLSDSYGWRIQPDGTGEFMNLKVNGNLDVYTLTYNEMRATNGILLVTDCACVTDAVDQTISGTYYWIIITDEYPPFAIDDYVQMQYRVDATRIFSFKGLVTAINADGDNSIRVLPLEGFQGQGTSTDDRGVTTFRTVDPDTASGKYIIRIGNRTDPNRQTIIKLNPYRGGYIDFMTGLNAPNRLADSETIQSKLPTATRLGNLSGVTYDGTELEGYGLFSDNAYLAGEIKNLNGKWALNKDGSGNLAGQHIVWDENGNITIKIGSGNTEITQYISSQLEISASGITSTINQTLNNYVQTSVFEQSISGISSHVTAIENNYATNSALTQWESSIEQTVSGISTTVSKIDKDYLTSGDKSELISTWEQTFSGITSRVEDIEKDYVKTGDISSASSEWNQTASGITSRVEAIEQNYVTKQTLSSATSSWQQTADGISAEVTSIKNNYAKKSDLGSYVTTSTFNQTSSSLTSSITALENNKVGKNELSGYVTTSTFNQTISSITASVSESQVTDRFSLSYDSLWENGTTANETNGKTYDQIKSAANNRLRTKSLYKTASKLWLSSGWKAYVLYFNGNGGYSAASGWLEPNSAGYISLNPSYGALMAIILAFTDNGRISPSAVNTKTVNVTTESIMTSGEVSLFVENGLSNFRVTADKITFSGYNTTIYGDLITANSYMIFKGGGWYNQYALGTMLIRSASNSDSNPLVELSGYNTPGGRYGRLSLSNGANTDVLWLQNDGFKINQVNCYTGNIINNGLYLRFKGGILVGTGPE